MQTEFENTENKEIMYAIVDIAGQQFKVEKDQKLYVHRLDGDSGAKVSFDKVLLIENEGKLILGNPLISGAEVSAKVLEHVKGDKVLVFKKKRRKGYQKLNGHRQYMTQIEITGISEKGAAKPVAKKETAPKAEAAEKPAAKTASKAAASKTAAPKKPAASAATKKPAAKKPAAKSTETKSTAAKTTAAKKPAAAKSASAAKPKASAAKKPAAKKPAAKKDDSSKASE